jgi:hypothetical protein
MPYTSKEIAHAEEIRHLREELAAVQSRNSNASVYDARGLAEHLVHKFLIPQEPVIHYDLCDKFTAAIQAYQPDSRVQRLVEAAAKMVGKMDLVNPAINPIFQYAKIHGLHYDGPTYEHELIDLRAALTPWNGGK